MWGTVLAAVAGEAMRQSGARDANTRNKNLSREERAWEERMSSTAHQREVADLKAAGLNPILSAGGSGASTPSVNPIPMVNEMQDAANTAVRASDLATAKKQRELLDQQTRSAANQADISDFDAYLARLKLSTAKEAEKLAKGITVNTGDRRSGRSGRNAPVSSRSPAQLMKKPKVQSYSGRHGRNAR